MKKVAEFRNTVSEIDKINRAAQNDPAAFVQKCERDYETQLSRVCDLALETKGERPLVILLAGPSSSGKTTTAHKLSRLFCGKGVQAPAISLDDFFLGKSQYPLLPDGRPDMESVRALDIELVNRCLSTLVSSGEALFPQFDFETSARRPESIMVRLNPGDALIVEGLHALNPVLVEKLGEDSLFKVYVSTRTKFMREGREILTPKDTRLIRRMVRDHNFRGHSPLSTLSMWDEVLEGEKSYIYPYRDDVDAKIDSALDYEPCIFHHDILPLVRPLLDEPACGGKICQIIEILEEFYDLEMEWVPADSLLREFIG
jgi:uridine kinase